MTTAVGGISRSSLRDQVLAVLRQRLVAGELKPGEIYSAQALAGELGVSGSPVREAMLTLVNQGLMEPVRNRGFMVIPISDDDRAEIAQLRRWLEVPAMMSLSRQNGLLRAREPQFRSLADDILAAAKRRDFTTFLDADREFHLGLTRLLGNQRLTSTVGDLRDQTRLYGLGDMQEESFLASAREHVAILNAILAGDQMQTEELMTTHLGHIMGDWYGEEA